MTKDYELTCLISAKIDEIERDSTIENINNLIKEKEGTITKANPSSEVILGYPIKKEEKAHLAVFAFTCEKQDLAGLKREIEKDQNMLRCFLKEAPVKKTIPLSRRKRGKKEEKVELKDIDKKIEEIFNTAGDATKNIPSEVNPKNNELQ